MHSATCRMHSFLLVFY